MRFPFWMRLAILAALVAGLAFVAYCGLSPDALRCPICAMAAPPPSEDPFAMRIVPPWYLLPVVGILRSVWIDLGVLDSKVLTYAILGAALFAPLSLAFTRWSAPPPRAVFGFVAVFAIVLALGWVGAQSPSDQTAMIAGQVLTVSYFLAWAFVFHAFANTAKAEAQISEF
jgi:quinol-cytochrome oxidoreductase complex cytochrome b subunit